MTNSVDLCEQRCNFFSEIQTARLVLVSGCTRDSICVPGNACSSSNNRRTSLIIGFTCLHSGVQTSRRGALLILLDMLFSTLRR